MNGQLAIVVPCYNEEEVLPDTDRVLNDLIKDLIKKETDSGFFLYPLRQ